MFRSEWKKLKSPMMIVVILALILVPFLYNSIFLSAFWDPYGRTEDIKVAIVNEDQATKFKGEKVDIGDQFVDKLKKNDDFDWQFLSQDKAQKELRDGKVYMTVVIPKNFSKNATTLLDDHPKKIELEYYLNPAKNYSGTQISSTAAKQLNEKIRKSVTKQYSSAIFGALKKIANGMEKASDGSSKLEDGNHKTADGARTLATNLGKLADGSLTLSEKLGEANQGSKKLSDGVTTLDEKTTLFAQKTGELSSGLNTLDENGGKLQAGAAQLQEGATKLSGGSTQVRQGAEQLAAGTAQLNEKIPQLTDGLNQLDEKAQAANAFLTQLNQDAEQAKQDLRARREALEANVAQLKEVISASEQLSDEEKQTLLGSIGSLEKIFKVLLPKKVQLIRVLLKQQKQRRKSVNSPQVVSKSSLLYRN